MINWIKKLFKKKEEPVVPLSSSSWTFSANSGRVVYKIPVGQMNPKEAKKQLKKLILNY